MSAHCNWENERSQERCKIKNNFGNLCRLPHCKNHFAHVFVLTCILRTIKTSRIRGYNLCISDSCVLCLSSYGVDLFT